MRRVGSLGITRAPESSEAVNSLFPQACVILGSFPRLYRYTLQIVRQIVEEQVVGTTTPVDKNFPFESPPTSALFGGGSVGRIMTLFHFQQLRGHYEDVFIECRGKIDQVTSVLGANIL